MFIDEYNKVNPKKNLCQIKLGKCYISRQSYLWATQMISLARMAKWPQTHYAQTTHCKGMGKTNRKTYTETLNDNPSLSSVKRPIKCF